MYPAVCAPCVGVPYRMCTVCVTLFGRKMGSMRRKALFPGRKEGTLRRELFLLLPWLIGLTRHRETSLHHPFHCWDTLRTSSVLTIVDSYEVPRGLFPRVTVNQLFGVEYPFHCWSRVNSCCFSLFYHFLRGNTSLHGPCVEVGRGPEREKQRFYEK